MNTEDFDRIAFTPRRYDDAARYLGLSPDSVRRWSTTAVMSSRIDTRIKRLIRIMADESGTTESFIHENAVQGRLHYLLTKQISEAHISELSALTIIQEQIDFDGDSIKYAPCTFNITFFNAAWIPYIFGPKPARAQQTFPARHTGYQGQLPHDAGRSLSRPSGADHRQVS